MPSVTQRAMSGPERATYAASKMVIRVTVVRRYLGGRPRLGALAPRGPLRPGSHHSSFLDHFILELIVFAACGDKTYILTKQEAFPATQKTLARQPRRDRCRPRKSQQQPAVITVSARSGSVGMALFGATAEAAMWHAATRCGVASQRCYRGRRAG